MVGKLFSMGITVLRHASGGWGASLEFQDGGFAKDRSISGTLRSRYFSNNLTEALDGLIADAKALGIGFGRGDLTPMLYVESDEVLATDDWKGVVPGSIVKEQARRLGWAADPTI